MQHLRVVVLLFLLLIPLSTCSKSPETARKELGQMNIDYTDESFLTYLERGDKVVVELFLIAGKSPNLRYKLSDRVPEMPILAIAAHKGHNEIVKLLITKGADVNATAENGKTVLIMAVADRNKEVVKVLLDNGANVNAEYVAYSVLKFSALTDAIRLGDLEIVKLLLDKGAKIKDIDLAAVEDLAAAQSPDTIEILKNLVNKIDDKTLLDKSLKIAKIKGWAEMVDALKNAGAKE